MKIIILHGLYMHGIVMRPLATKLRNLGYRTKLISYNSLAINERQLFKTLDNALAEDMPNIFIGHSLGGLIIKRYLNARQLSPEHVSHVIALGSPLQGASIVDLLSEFGLKPLLGNSPSHGLDKHQDEWTLPQKLGSIAGTLPIGARSFLLWPDKSLSDGTVTVEETKISGMTDHLLMKNTHTSLVYSNKVVTQIDHFIHHNQFNKLPVNHL
ncbi:triacylglycerol lipase [Vibrio sp. SCSIO 43136]|uniref:PGAP1-like alpha/beta domain-containing protein n=1 Tax=Vibrio sp. SCSIO 43136 TaxID=2819101 RepID=UPI00207640E5|nr:triacylglycerol lipase [Vibrio sp. SCSIO 43136]USD67673.1 triacylglycerol lipase [Vibrio sp. SCSIO 43136]